MAGGMSRPLLNLAGRALPVDDAMRLSDRLQVSVRLCAWHDAQLARYYGANATSAAGLLARYGLGFAIRIDLSSVRIRPRPPIYEMKEAAN